MDYLKPINIECYGAGDYEEINKGAYIWCMYHHFVDKANNYTLIITDRQKLSFDDLGRTDAYWQRSANGILHMYGKLDDNYSHPFFIECIKEISKKDNKNVMSVFIKTLNIMSTRYA